MKRLAFAALLAACTTAAALAAGLNEGQTRALTAYLSALQRADYPGAYAQLAASEQRYYRNARNFASVFTADRFQLHGFSIGAAPVQGASGAVAAVTEKITTLDPAHQALFTATVPVHYGIVKEGSAYRIRDPLHPWKSFVPAGATAAHDKLTVTVRKVSFYRDRIELIVTFANTSGTDVTFFPYGRSVMHDEADHVYRPVDSATAARIDNELFLGLRLPTSAQYTGILAFRFADPAHVPAKLDLNVSPIVREGAEAPLELDVAAMSVPP